MLLNKRIFIKLGKKFNIEKKKRERERCEKKKRRYINESTILYLYFGLKLSTLKTLIV